MLIKTSMIPQNPCSILLLTSKSFLLLWLCKTQSSSAPPVSSHLFYLLLFSFLHSSAPCPKWNLFSHPPPHHLFSLPISHAAFLQPAARLLPISPPVNMTPFPALEHCTAIHWEYFMKFVAQEIGKMK